MIVFCQRVETIKFAWISENILLDINFDIVDNYIDPLDKNNYNNIH